MELEEQNLDAKEAQSLSKELEDKKKNVTKRGEVIRFVGKDGKDYITKYDSDVFGGGYVGVRRYHKKGVPIEKADEFEKEPSEKPGSGSVNYEVLPLSELKEIARDLKIRGWNLASKKTLVEKIVARKQK